MEPLLVEVSGETDSTITLKWDPPADQYGYVPLIDGSDIMTDGKKHPGLKADQGSVKFTKPKDETNPFTVHSYGVRILTASSEGEATARPTTYDFTFSPGLPKVGDLVTFTVVDPVPGSV